MLSGRCQCYVLKISSMGKRVGYRREKEGCLGFANGKKKANRQKKSIRNMYQEKNEAKRREINNPTSRMSLCY